MTPEQKGAFTGLDYFEGDSYYCVPAIFTYTDDANVFDMPTFDAASIPFREYGIFKFEIGA